MTALGKRFGDLEAIPEAIKEQIGTSTEVASFDDKVLIALEQLDGEATVNELLVEVWRATGDAGLKKQTISRSLYRLKENGMVERVRKGVYKINEDEYEETQDE